LKSRPESGKLNLVFKFMIPDRELIKKSLQGDEKSLELLIKKYLKPIYSFSFNLLRDQQDAQDLTQEIFLKMWKNLKNFDENQNFKSWLFKIAKNSCIDFIRKKKKFLVYNLETIENLPDLQLLLKEEAENKDLLEKIKIEIEKLSRKSKEILNLYYNFGFNFREIAQISGESINTVKSRHKRAIDKIKNSLKEK
jgi:RNA polymerase sigma-70 factor (ECF subfamily)